MVFLLLNAIEVDAKSEVQPSTCTAPTFLLTLEASHNAGRIPQYRQDISEMNRIGTRPELGSTRRPVGEQFTLGQQTLKLSRNSRPRVDQADVIGDHLL